MNISDHSLPPLEPILSSADQAIVKLIRETLNLRAIKNRMQSSPMLPDDCAFSRDDRGVKP